MAREEVVPTREQVADDALLKFTQDGKFIRQWTDLPFGRPAGFAIQPDDTLYVSDSDGQSVHIIRDGKVVEQGRPVTQRINRAAAINLIEVACRRVGIVEG